MKTVIQKIFLIALFFCIAGFSFAQDNTKNQFSQILNSYFAVKNALVNNDANLAAGKSADLLKAINAVETNSLPEADNKTFTKFKDKIAYDARHISESKEIAHQREHFATLSANIFALAKKIKLSDQPIYKNYCPMKKAYWLSNEKEIKNPYFGNTMLTCGKIEETLQ